MTPTPALRLRALEANDDPTLAALIRAVLIEYGANQAGFAWEDPDLDTLSVSYSRPGSLFLVAIGEEGSILGGAGIAPFSCHQVGTCELQKMYLVREARGRGVGSLLLTRLLQEARQLQYQYCYLETLMRMVDAGRLYQRFGFEPLTEAWGDSGHGGCDQWYVKKL